MAKDVKPQELPQKLKEAIEKQKKLIQAWKVTKTVSAPPRKK